MNHATYLRAGVPVTALGLLFIALAVAPGARGQSPVATSAPRNPPCASCATWNAEQQPFRVFGNAYYVGTHGLGAILVTSDSGHVLIDAALPESVPLIVAHIRALGFRIEDVKLLLNSHDHFDHAGGMAELQKLSGAPLAVSPPSAAVFRSGLSGQDDPQYGLVQPIARVRDIRVVADGETLHVGPIAVTAHFTAGHTPGGTTWSWRSCEAGRCADMVYADSQTPVSADGFFFTRSRTYPSAIQDFEHGHAALEAMPCDILLTPHPDASGMWERLARRDAGEPLAFINPMACKEYAATARKALARRIAIETGTP